MRLAYRLAILLVVAPLAACFIMSPVEKPTATVRSASLGTASLTCPALGTLTGTSQELGFGAIPLAAPAYNGGGWVQWSFWATGVQCEGASAAQLVSQGLGFEE